MVLRLFDVILRSILRRRLRFAQRNRDQLLQNAVIFLLHLFPLLLQLELTIPLPEAIHLVKVICAADVRRPARLGRREFVLARLAVELVDLGQTLPMADHVDVHLSLLQGAMLVYELDQFPGGLPDDRCMLPRDRHAVARTAERALGALRVEKGQAGQLSDILTAGRGRRRAAVYGNGRTGAPLDPDLLLRFDTI